MEPVTITIVTTAFEAAELAARFARVQAAERRCAARGDLFREALKAYQDAKRERREAYKALRELAQGKADPQINMSFASVIDARDSDVPETL